jgi:NADPH2:quinone reductase
MRAVAMDHCGGPEVLGVRDIATPAIVTDTEVLIRVRAAGVNPIDAKLRRAASGYPVRLPAVLGFDGAGVVEAVGSSVSRFNPGDEVYYCYPAFGGKTGSYADFQVVEERYLARKPVALTFEQAAAAPLVLITAWESLHLRGRIQEGDTVLVHGGAGGVGHMAIQLAKRAGARVCTTVSSPEKAAFVESLGADETVFYREENPAIALLEWTDEQGVDLALDTVGGKVFEHTFTMVKVGGDLVTLLQPDAGINWTVARQRNLSVHFELMLTPSYLGMEVEQREQSRILEQCTPWFEHGDLWVSVAESFPLEAAAEAHRRLEAGGSTGKLVLRCG